MEADNQPAAPSDKKVDAGVAALFWNSLFKLFIFLGLKEPINLSIASFLAAGVIGLLRYVGVRVFDYFGYAKTADYFSLLSLVLLLLVLSVAILSALVIVGLVLREGKR